MFGNSRTPMTCAANQRIACAAAFLLVSVVVAGMNQAALADSGAVSGVVTFDGPTPERRPIQLSDSKGQLSDCHELHEQGLLDEDLIVGEASELSNVFVYVKKGYERKKYPAPDEPAILNQVGCMFRPRVQGVMIGQNFVMKNGDPVLHNVRALSFRNRPFNVAQPARSPDRTKVFTRKEQAVTVQCDLHPWMKAFYFVMDHPYFAVTNDKGEFRIEGLPPGEYTLAAWHEELGEQDVKVTVAETGSSPVEFSFKPKKSNVVIAKVKSVSPSRATTAPTESLPPRPFVRKWTLEELTADVADLAGRSLARGREVFHAAGCIKCHVIAGKGEKLGPELTDVVKRFKGSKLLEQVLTPSVEIHEDFQTHLFVTDAGKVIAGLIVKDSDEAFHVLSNPLEPDEIEIISKQSVEQRRKSEVSTMPEGLLDTFTRDEILDLIAFVQSGGKIEE